jgi:hypothetical protein
MQLANGSRNESLGLIENLKLKIGGMKLFVQAHIIRNSAYDVLLGRLFNILTALHIKNYHDESQTIMLTDVNCGKMVSIPTVPHSQPHFKMPPPEEMNCQKQYWFCQLSQHCAGHKHLIPHQAGIVSSMLARKSTNQLQRKLNQLAQLYLKSSASSETSKETH